MRIVFYGRNTNGGWLFIGQRDLTKGEHPDLHAEARAKLDQVTALEDEFRPRIVRDDVADTPAIQAQLMNGSTLVDQDEAYRS